VWYVYILRCKNKSLYTGITNDLARRLKAHQTGKGSWFTRVFGAEEIIYTEEHPTKSDAFKRELQIKRFTRKQKDELVRGQVVAS
jgi:putative endonuclease